MDDIKLAARLGVDYLAVSFPKTGADMYMARTLLQAAFDGTRPASL
jgi:pyruvate kinase